MSRRLRSASGHVEEAVAEDHVEQGGALTEAAADDLVEAATVRFGVMAARGGSDGPHPGGGGGPRL
jgi:hypothetical protein